MDTTKLLPLTWTETKIRDKISVAGESIGYTLCQFDARSDQQRVRNLKTQTLDGNLIVYLPGHGHTAAAAKKLVANLLAFAPAKLVWSVDIHPPKGGDPVKAQALVELIHQRVGPLLFNSPTVPMPQVSLFGWSHGAGEAIRTATQAPELFPHLVCFCPTGMIDRSALNLVIRFGWECLLIFGDALIRFDGTILNVLALGLDVAWGIFKDLTHTKSPRRVINDIRWASHQASSDDNPYDGKVVVLFGRKDTVIRWQDVFPHAKQTTEIEKWLTHYQQHNFPQVEGLQVKVLEGNHIAPEILAPLYVRTAFELLD